MSKGTHTRTGKRLTDADKAFALQLRAQDLSQVEIAQRLGRDQSTISRWLQNFEDSTGHAKAFLSGRALKMAENIVAKGRAADHVKTLQGLGVLADEQSSGVTIIIGGRDTDVHLHASHTRSEVLDAEVCVSPTLPAHTETVSN